MSGHSLSLDTDVAADGASVQEPLQTEGCPGKSSSMSSKASKSLKHKGRRQMDDDFMMRLYKIKLCTRTTPHNWKLCPWAHPGEAAALRRDPTTHMAEMCPAVRQHQECPHGEGCLYARNTFECWLHPHRYRTTMCSSGEACTRNICFFAHNESELRSTPDCAGPQQQQWSLPGGVDLDPQLLLDMALPAQPMQQMVSTGAGGVLGPMPAGLGEPASSTLPSLSPHSHSCPLPVVSMGAPWGGLVYPGTSTSRPALVPSPQAQLPVTAQQVLMQPIQAGAGGFTPLQLAPASAPRPGVLGCLPVSAGMGVTSLQGGVIASQAPMVLHGQQACQQFSPAVPSYDMTAMAGMYAGDSQGSSLMSTTAGVYPAADSQSSSLMSVVTTGPSPGGSVSDFPALQQLSAEQYASQDLKWQQQQQQVTAMQHAALLLQQLQLAGAATGRRMSTESLHTSLLQSSSASSSTIPHLSQLSASDFSTDSLSLSALMAAGYPITQDLGMVGVSSRPLPLLNRGVFGQQDVQLLPLEACGLIQMSALDDGPVAPYQELPATMAMPHPGGYW